MNKSKFLKRSLATLLAILMVVAMVPMSAFAAVTIAEDVPTARADADPGYRIALNGVAFVWDGSKYVADYSYTNDKNVNKDPTVGISLQRVLTDTTFTIRETSQILGPNNQQVKLSAATKSVDAYGTGIYAYNMDVVTTGASGELQTTTYTLAINVTVRQMSDDTKVLGVRAGEMPYMVTYKVDYTDEGGVVTIVLALNKDIDEGDHFASENGIELIDSTYGIVRTDDLKKIFKVGDYVKYLSLAKGKLTVTAENDDTATYEIKLVNEESFTAFALGEYNKVDIEDVTSPKLIVVDLPYDKFFVGDNNPMGESGYDHANITTIEGKISALVATWTAAREQTVVLNGSDSEIKSGKKTLTFTHAAGLETTEKAKTGKGLVGKNPNEHEKYMLFETTVKVDNLSKYENVDLETIASDFGVVKIVARVPRENPSAKLNGIQIQGDNSNNDPSDDYSSVSEGTGAGDGSKTWSQYVAVTGETINIDIKVPWDALPESTMTSAGDDAYLENARYPETSDKIKRAYIKVWGAFGANVELPWDRVTNVASAASEDTATADDFTKVKYPNGFAVSDGGKNTNDTIRGAKNSAISEVPIQVNDINDQNKSVVKTVIIRVTSEDGSSTTDYRLTVNETTVKYPQALASIKLYNGTTLVATGVADSDQNYTLKVPYALGSDDADDGTLEGYRVEAVAADGSRISYSQVGANSAPVGFHPFVQSQTVGKLTGADGTLVAKELSETPIQEANKNTFILRVWSTENWSVGADPDPYINEFRDHTVTITMESPDTARNIKSATVSPAGTNETDATTAPKFTTTMSGRNLTADLPYAYKYIDKIAFSELLTGGTGAKVYYADPGDSDKLKPIAAAAGDITTNTNSGGEVLYSSIADAAHDRWLAENKKGIKLYVFSEQALTKLKHKYTGPATAIVDHTAKAVAEIDSDYTFWTEYTLDAKPAASATGNSLLSISAPTDTNVDISKDDHNRTITVKVPNKYINTTSLASASSLAKSNHPFTIDFTVSDKARVYVAATDSAAKVLDNTVPAGGIPYFTLRKKANSNAIIANNGDKLIAATDATKFWVEKDGTKTALYVVGPDGLAKIPAKTLIVVTEGSCFGSGQENGSATVYTIKLDTGKKESDPSITSLSVGGRAAALSADVDGNLIWTANMPAGSDPAQLLDIKTAGKFTELKIGDEGYSTDAFYIAHTIEDATIVATAENGLTETYTLKVVNGDLSGNTSLAEVRADGYTAVQGANNTYVVSASETANLSAMSLNVRAADSKVQGITVNGAAYTAGMIIDLSEGKAVTIVVTAQNGTRGTYTLTATTGTMPPVGNESDKFNDIPTGAMGELVKDAINLGLMGSTSTTASVFSPDRKIIRSHFALAVARADLKKGDSTITDSKSADAKLLAMYSGKAPFSDTASKDTIYNAAIEYCKNKGIIKGNADGTFAPDKNIDRLEVASILKNWCNLADGGSTNTYEFTDWNQMNWGKENVNAVRAAGLMSGRTNGSFGAKDYITRAETAVILVNSYKYSAN